MAQDQQLNQLLTVENSFPKLPEFFISFAKNKLRTIEVLSVYFGSLCLNLALGLSNESKMQ
ncbi:transmembrane protein, putative [Medicago truncatula]|uniref:Transmembrane protein, putative n=1 Tax=Medicago truncatula TaxID=3880 RepID=A0A072UC21_MEDTR|nr:transmembrane protein, putative [Medicago truncatula]